MKARPNSFAFCGGAFGDEGKGRIVDEYVNTLGKKEKVVVYRDNGGANAGHTVTLPNGKRVALHQLPSGIFHNNATVILGKGMVIHPSDLLFEFQEVFTVMPKKKLATIKIDEMAVLSLDTHRAYEAALKMWQEGSKGSTGRGIAPAYADIILRYPLRMRDLKNFDTQKITQHYLLYEALLNGLECTLSQMKVPRLDSSELIEVGTLEVFVQRLKEQAELLKQYIEDVSIFVTETWNNPKFSYVFEKAQAIGLDARWGVYPDVTASDCTFDGIFAASEGVINPSSIKVRAAVIKATYMSSVGARKLPTLISGKLAERIRKDAHEYGATTKRPRDIAYLDIPALRFYAQVGHVNCHILTHMDICYLDTPIKVCIDYQIDGKSVSYRPDQEFVLKVSPVYAELPPWSREEIQKAKTYEELPENARNFLSFIQNELGTIIPMITTGPTRDQSVRLKNHSK